MPAPLPLVASVCVTALEQGMPPVRAVEERFAVSRMTATRWVRKAKDARLLPDVSYVQRPNRKVVAIARRLGVEPEELRRAVLELADGRLVIR